MPTITDEEQALLDQAKAVRAAQSAAAKKVNSQRTTEQYRLAAKRAWRTKRKEQDT